MKSGGVSALFSIFIFAFFPVFGRRESQTPLHGFRAVVSCRWSVVRESQKTQPARGRPTGAPGAPKVGTQAQFKKKLPPKTYKFDSSLSPAMDWDGQNPAREQGEANMATAEGALHDYHTDGL